MINRCAVVITAKQPFLDWLRQLPDPVRDDMTLGELNKDAHVYLGPESAMEHGKDRFLKKHARFLIERECNAWWTNEADWPRKRNFKMLTEWFEASFHSMIEDLGDDMILDDEF